MNFKKKTDQQILSNDCGISAVKTIFNIFQIPISRQYIKDSIPLEEKGSHFSDIKLFFERNGFNADYKLLDINSIQEDISSLKELFPFILPVKSKEGLHYVVVNSIKRNKVKIYNPSKGSEYYLDIQEVKKQAHFHKSFWDLARTKETIKAFCSDDLANYGIKIEDALHENEGDIAKLFNKLTYFTYLKRKFQFKDITSEKNFIIDLIKNQEISNVPKNFRSLNFKAHKISVKAPLILVVNPNKNDISNHPVGEEENIYWKLYKQLGDNKKLWYIYIFATLFSALFTQFSVFINQILIDHVLPSFNMGTLLLFAIGLCVYKLFDIITSAYKQFVGIHLSNILDRFFLQKFDEKINLFSLPYIQSYKKGDLIERVSDALKLKKFFVKFFTTLIIDVFISLYSLIILFYINWKLTLMITIVMIFFYLWFKFITPHLKRNEKLRYIKKADFLSKMIEKIEGIQVLKSFGIEHSQSNKVNSSAKEYLKIQLKNGYISLLNTMVVAVIIVASSILIIVLLSKSTLENNFITLGQIVTFIALSNKVFGSLKSILVQNLTLQENEVILNRFLDFEEKNVVNEDDKGINNFEIKSINIKELFFSYHSNINILKDINILIYKGEKIQIEGNNGSGKSTLSKVLTTLYKPSSGEILINENDIRFYNQRSVRNKILLSTNEDILFNDTIEGNICLGKDISKTRLIEVAKKIDFYDFIVSKDEGLDFIINENAKNLSTGQRKKILLLRAFFSKAEVIILDEVLSGIDKESRTKIEHFINKDPRTFIIISHEIINEINFSKKYKLENGALRII